MALLSGLLFAQPQGVDWISQVKNKPVVDPRTITFRPQTPGGTLTASSPATVTMRPCPLGLNGSDANHPVYISAGTGTAEAVLITGGTCTSGISSGTIIFTPANNHSGAWTIQSATAGCQEAYYSNGGVGNLHILFPQGTFTTFAPCRVNASGVWISGAGPTGTVIAVSGTNVDGFQFIAASNGQGNMISDLQISGNPASTTNYAVNTVNQTYFTAERIFAFDWGSGTLNNNGVTWTARDFFVRNLNGGDGYVGTGAGSNAAVLDNLQVVSGTACEAAVKILQGGETQILNSQLINCNHGMLLQPTAGANVFSTDVQNTYFDHDATNGLTINPGVGSSVIRTRCVQCWFASAGTFGVSIQGAGSVDGLLIQNSEISGNGSNGFNAANTLALDQNVEIIGGTVASNTGAGVVVPSNALTWSVTGATIGNNISGWGSSPQLYGIFVNGGDLLSFTGNRFIGNGTAPIALPSALSNVVIGNNIGIDNTLPTFASSTTLTITGGPFQKIKVTGTTTITTINGSLWVSKTLYIAKTDAGSVTIGGGGNIPGSHTLAQNGSLTLTYDGSNWY